MILGLLSAMSPYYSDNVMVRRALLLSFPYNPPILYEAPRFAFLLEHVRQPPVLFAAPAVSVNRDR